MSVSGTVHHEQESCKSDHATYMGGIHGKGRRDPSYAWDERAVSAAKTNDRADLWNSQREPCIQIHAAIRKSQDDNESRANLRMHESEETGKDPEKEEAVG